MWKEYQLRIDDLKQENLQLKKHIKKLTDNIHLNKVRIRKLEVECKKRDKEIYVLMDPKQSKTFQHRMCDDGASFIMRLKRENEKMRRHLTEKDIIIKRLHNEKRANVVYQTGEKEKKKVELNEVATSDTELHEIGINTFLTGIKQENHSLGQIIKSLQCQKLDKLYTNLQKIKENYNNQLKLVKHSDEKAENVENTEYRTIVQDTSLSSDIEFSCDTPHEEIQKLQNYFIEMFTEVDDLKLIINKLQKDHSKLSEAYLNASYDKKSKQSLDKNSLSIKRSKSANRICMSKSSTKVIDHSEEEEIDICKSEISSKLNFNIYNEYLEIATEEIN